MRAATYARYSSDKQRESSIEDQQRNCRYFAERESLEIVLHYKDQAISGSTTARPDYQRMLGDAEKGLFDVLLVDDLSRLSRDEVEMKRVLRKLTFQGLRVVGVSDGYDSNAKSHKIHAGVKGLMNELYLDDLRDKVHRGLTGKALQGYACGGRTYGYNRVPIGHPTKTDPYGRPEVIAVRYEVNEEQAKWVRKIFEWYADGYSARWIADRLNRLDIASPKKNTWCVSAIHGVRQKQTGLLNNEMYIGNLVWNKTQWIKNPETGKRVHRSRPKEEWIISEMSELRIIPQDLWTRVKNRQMDNEKKLAEMQRLRGEDAAYKPRYGYLLSGLLKCGVCGGNYTVRSKDRYGCSVHKDRGAHVCTNNKTISRYVLEDRILAGVKQELCHKDAAEFFMREAAEKLKLEKDQSNEKHLRRQLEEVQKEIGNILTAIKAGIITASTKEELEKAEARRNFLGDEIEAEKRREKELAAALPQATERFKSAVSELEKALSHEIPKARTILKTLVGDEIRLIPVAGHLEAEIKKNMPRMMERLVQNNGWIDTSAARCYHLACFRVL